jgi:LysR family transcriptional regulator, transcriptional activator of nhaA
LSDPVSFASKVSFTALFCLNAQTYAINPNMNQSEKNSSSPNSEDHESGYSAVRLESLIERVNFHHLYYFWVVAKCGSIRNASKQLMLAAPTVSRQIKELEDKLHVKLIIRSSRNFTLTEKGLHIRRYCDELFGLAREMMDGLEGHSLTRPLRLTVGVAGVIPKLVLYKILEPALHLKSPVQIICHEGNTSRLVQDLSNHTLDIVLTDSPIGPYPELRSYSHLIAESPILVCGNKAAAKKYGPNFPRSLDGAPILLPTPNCAFRSSLDTYFYESKIVPHIRGEFEDSTIIKVFGEAGLGLFFVPAIIESEVKRRFHCESIGQIDSVTARFYVVSPQRRVSNPAVTAIMDLARHSLMGTLSDLPKSNE